MLQQKFWTTLSTRRDLRALTSKYVSIAHLLHSVSYIISYASTLIGNGLIQVILFQDHRSMHSLAVVPRPPVRIFFDHLSSKSNSAKSGKSSSKSNKVQCVIKIQCCVGTRRRYKLSSDMFIIVNAGLR